MSESRASPLLSLLEEDGGVLADYHGQPVARHFGDPAGEYEAATGSVALFDRSHRARLVVSGKAPGQMLNGVLTGTIPLAPHRVGSHEAAGDVPVGAGGPDGANPIWAGHGTYHAVLTPKGKMITDLWAYRLGEDESAGYLLDVPVAGREGLLGLFAKVLPPRFAAVRDASDEIAMVSVVGPDAAPHVARGVFDGLVGPDRLASMEEGEWRSPGLPTEALVVVRTAEVGPPAFSIWGPAEMVRELFGALRAAGSRPAGLGVWSTLRVEAGRPAFGTDMDEDTIPVEAGIADRAIDHGKGCYTGQEVIVRIRDRGHVNRSLRRLQLGDVPTPAHGTELLAADGSGKVVGRVTSAVQSPATEGVVALAYVRRGEERCLLGDIEVEVPA